MIPVCRKNQPKSSTIHFLPNIIHSLNSGKSSPKMWATFIIFKNCPKKTIAQSGHPVIRGYFLKQNPVQELQKPDLS
jgi:hypothetical protein